MHKSLNPSLAGALQAQAGCVHSPAGGDSVFGMDHAEARVQVLGNQACQCLSSWVMYSPGPISPMTADIKLARMWQYETSYIQKLLHFQRHALLSMQSQVGLTSAETMASSIAFPDRPKHTTCENSQEALKTHRIWSVE